MRLRVVALLELVALLPLAGCGGSDFEVPSSSAQAERIATTASLTDDDLPGEWWTDEAFADAPRDIDGKPVVWDAPCGDHLGVLFDADVGDAFSEIHNDRDHMTY